jgi:hypothetical protein
MDKVAKNIEVEGVKNMFIPFVLKFASLYLF